MRVLKYHILILQFNGSHLVGFEYMLMFHLSILKLMLQLYIMVFVDFFFHELKTGRERRGGRGGGWI